MKIFEISWMVSVLRLLQVKAKGPRLTWKGEAVEEDSTLSDDSAPRKRSRTPPLAPADAPDDSALHGVNGRLQRNKLTAVNRGHNIVPGKATDDQEIKFVATDDQGIKFVATDDQGIKFVAVADRRRQDKIWCLLA